jgi:muconate cycloisomerase
MQLVGLDLIHIGLPLKKPIKHASHTRDASDNLVVRVVLADGTAGHGEGVPRDYVTGETVETCFEAIRGVDLGATIGRPTSFEEVVSRLEAWTLPTIANDPRGMFGNAARCAAEVAILDAYGRHFGRSIGEVVRISEAGRAYAGSSPRRVRYSGAITAEGERKERIAAWKMRIYGFRHVKVKVGIPGQDDRARLTRFRRILGDGRDMRVDANESWKAGELIERVEEIRASRPSALEQPVAHEEVEALAELRPKLGIPVMLDESLCGLPDGRAAIEKGWADIFNVRLSKCGGILPSLALAAMAYRAGLAVQLGCHPGESAVLSAAGRGFAANLKGIRYLEGSYDKHVLRDNLATTDITFGYGGRAKPLNGAGLGIEIDAAKLAAVTIRKEEVRYA